MEVQSDLSGARGSASSLRHAIENLSCLRAFVAAVETKNFTRAGQRLGVVPSTISKQIAALERAIEGRLFLRSTQSLSVTELGLRFYEHAVSILDEVDAAEREIVEYNAEPQGLLRVTAGTVFAQRYLMPIMMSFLEKYPKVLVDITLSTIKGDLVGDGFDVAIRISNELDPDLIAIKLAPNIRVYCAAPGYLDRRGTPVRAADLEAHNCLVVRGVNQSSRWPIVLPDGNIDHVPVSGNFVSDNGDLVRQAALGGGGIAHLPLFMVHDDLASGALVELFPNSRIIASNIYAVFPDRRNLPLKTRAFLDHLKVNMRQGAPWGDDPVMLNAHHG